MINQLAVALIAYLGKIASVSAQDENGYVGTEYAFVGNGHCIPADSTTHYGHAANTILTGSVQTCATHCQSFNNIDGQVGFDMYTNPNDGNVSCSCRYTAGTGPEGDTGDPTTDGMSYTSSSAGPVAGTDNDSNAICYKRNAFGQTDSPTNAPSTSPSTGSPTNGPSTSPSKIPTGSPVQGPSTSVVATAGGAAIPEDSLYYPDWSKSDGGCKTGGGQPTYMTLDASIWMLATLNECCVRYFGWMVNKCKGASGAAPSGLWFPDWEGPDDTCKNDGSEPEYMALNPESWMHSSKEDCCEANFGWMLNECLGSSANATDKWFMDWNLFKCKKDCDVGTGPSCGGRANWWDGLFDTRSACCAEKAAWNPTDCLVD